MTDKIPVLITGVGGGGYGHELVKTLRLADAYMLIGVDATPSSLGLFDVDAAYTVPLANDPTYIDVLLDICAHYGVKALLHGSDPELKVISANRARFQAAGILPLVNTPEVIELGMDKWKTIQFFKAHGFACPESVFVESLAHIPADFPLPAIVKPATGGGGSNNTFLVQDAEELSFACRYVIKQGKAVLVQAYIGTPEDEYTVGILHTLEGVLIGSIAMRRQIMSGLSNRIKVPNRTGRAELSPILAVSSGISQGTIDDYPDVRQQCEAIAATAASKGPINIQCRFVNGKVYPFEINPRFSGTSYHRALVGFNEPHLLIQHHVVGNPIQTPTYKSGQVVRGLAERYIAEDDIKQTWGA